MKKIRHFINSEDFNKKEYLEILRRMAIFDKHPEKAYGLAKGKVLASMFFKESTRTSSAAQAAMVRLGGGYIGISGTSGTYLAAGDEDFEDFLFSFIQSADIMVIRHNTLDLNKYRDRYEIPVINGLCAGHEHTLAGPIYFHELQKAGVDLNKLKIGLLGQNKNCRPFKTMGKLVSLFGGVVYEDPVVDALGTPKEIVDFIHRNGGQYIKAKLDTFIDKVDMLCIADGLPSTTEDPKLMEEYNKKFHTITLADLKDFKGKIIMYMMPRAMTDGRLTVAKEVDSDPRVMNNTVSRTMMLASMAVFTFLLDIKVK
ncbi:MAG: hypothetical protein WC750_05390 [Patescibacteria group bacterium]|jgi:aspartate carbamoyltransferase catalytic subunit